METAARCIFLVPAGRTGKKAGSDTKGQPDYEVFGNVIRELDKFSQQRGNGYQLAVKGQLFLFLYYAYGRGILFAEKKPGHAREKIEGILDYIREHFGEEITIKQGSRAVLLQ